MSQEVSGTYVVSMTPAEASFDDSKMGRFLLNKTYSGPLQGSSQGEMLSVRTSIETSAGYVALERFSGKLDGREGSFVLQHFGIMSKMEQRLNLEVVPDSGEGELKGISGKMEITRSEGAHLYRFYYAV